MKRSHTTPSASQGKGSRLARIVAAVTSVLVAVAIAFAWGGKAEALPRAGTATVLVYLWLSKPGGNIASAALHNATTAYIPLAALWVMLFAANRGLLTRLMSNRVTLFIGNISAYAFLIHFVITEYASHCLSFRGIRVDGWGRVLLVSAELLLSIGLSLLYKKLHERYIDKKA